VRKPIARDIIADASIARGIASQKGNDSLMTSMVDVYAPIPMNAAWARLSSPMFRMVFRLHAKMILIPIKQSM
jgi:hypothetical protein